MARHQRLPSRGLSVSKGTGASDLWNPQGSGWCESVNDNRKGKTFCLCGEEVQLQGRESLNLDGSLHSETCPSRNRVDYTKRFGSKAAGRSRRFKTPYIPR